jgi:hypothetical protein
MCNSEAGRVFERRPWSEFLIFYVFFRKKLIQNGWFAPIRTIRTQLRAIGSAFLGIKWRTIKFESDALSVLRFNFNALTSGT